MLDTQSPAVDTAPDGTGLPSLSSSPSEGGGHTGITPPHVSGQVFTFANAGPTTARMFGVTLPGGIEEMFAVQNAYLVSVNGSPDLAELAQLCAAWGSVLGPPISATSAPARLA